MTQESSLLPKNHFKEHEKEHDISYLDETVKYLLSFYFYFLKSVIIYCVKTLFL